MKLGVAISWRGATIDSSRKIALESERAGFEYLWLTEAWGMEALSTTGYLLGMTSRIKLGVGVLNIFSRSAALIGMACATLDQVAPGRFILGLGASGGAVVEKWHGMTFSRPLQRTKEYVEIVRRVARGEEVNYEGEILKLAGFRLYTKPKETNQEIYIGAIGEKNLKLAGQIADGAIVTMYPFSKMSTALQILRRSLPSDSREKLLFAYLPFRVVQTSEEVQRRRIEVAKNIAFYISSMGKYYAKKLAELGFEKNVERVIMAYKEGGSKEATAAVDDQLIDELSLIGSQDQILDKLRKIPEGVIPVLSIDSSETQLDSLGSMLKEVDQDL